jgi:uncharacterized protein with HEPN domain
MKESQRDKDVFKQILNYIGQCRRIAAQAKSEEKLLSDPDALAIVERDLEQIGEGMKAISSQARQALIRQGIQVSQITGMRNYLAHPYFNFDNGVLWPTIQSSLKPLEKAIKTYLKRKN